jgi:exodeoxyribonuclease-3
MIKIATWNLNSIKARLPILLDWLADAAPDVALLQEIKTTEDAFPRREIENAGYHAAVAGQKTYNGVAVLSKRPIDVSLTALPGDSEDPQARYLEAWTSGVRVASVYVPNGNPVDGDKFPYKLAFLDRLYTRTRELLLDEEVFVLGGDYNVAPDDDDVFDPPAWADDALCRPESRARLRKILYLGLTDALGHSSPEVGRYTWWDYRGGAFSRDHGLRIDHLLLSPHAADRLADAGIDRAVRSREKTSDHAPVWCRLEDGP